MSELDILRFDCCLYPLFILLNNGFSTFYLLKFFLSGRLGCGSEVSLKRKLQKLKGNQKGRE